jgi:hypothetical protein
VSANPRRWAVAALLAATLVIAAPAPAQAFNLAKPICSAGGLISGVVGKVCTVASRAPKLLGATKKLLGGHLGQALSSLTSSGAKAFGAAAAFAAATSWVLGGARAVLRETAAVISSTTRPELRSTWFSKSYWRMAAIAALLTLPFLFAAAIQALVRSDLSLLARSALGYLPLGVLAVCVAAPITQLLLSASDEMSRLVSSASGYSTASVSHLGALTIGVSALTGQAFPVFFVGLLAVAATFTLWIELLIRAAAVYVIVLMLPLFFAAMVWPARRIWVIRALEVLLALIMSKFAIVAVLSLGGAALGHTTVPSVVQMLAGTTLVMLAAFSPWALLRLLPLHELASGLEGLRHAPGQRALVADAGGQAGAMWVESLPDQLPDVVPAHDHAAEEPDGARAAREGLAPQPQPAVAGERSGAGPGGPAVADARDDIPDRMMADAVDQAPPSAEGFPVGAGSQGGAGSVAPGPGSGAEPGGAPAERLPGMPPRWQQADGDWHSVLGPEGVEGATEASGEAHPAEDPDPLPPEQDPEDGIL